MKPSIWAEEFLVIFCKDDRISCILRVYFVQPCFLKIDEVAYVDKGRNLAVALGERDVKVINRNKFYVDTF